MMMLRHPWVLPVFLIIYYDDKKVAAVLLLEADEPTLLLEIERI